MTQPRVNCFPSTTLICRTRNSTPLEKYGLPIRTTDIHPSIHRRGRSSTARSFAMEQMLLRSTRVTTCSTKCPSLATGASSCLMLGFVTLRTTFRSPIRLDTTAFRRLRIAQLFLHRHERFHFRVDAWTLSMEAVIKRSLYVEYLSNVYGRVAPGTDCVEESLANDHAYQALRRMKIGSWMSSFMSAQPGAYANYRFKSSEEKRVAKAKLSMQISEGAGWVLSRPADSIFHAPFVGQGRYLSEDRNCPTWEVRLRNLSSLLLPSLVLPEIGEFKQFVVGYLRGTPHARTDHEKFRIDNSSIVRIPNKHKGEKRLRVYELAGTLRQAGMQNKEYEEERSRTRIWTDEVPRKVVKPALV